jgi:hypothetical protein
MLFFGRSFSFLVAVVLVLLFVSTLYEYRFETAKGRPGIWKAKESSDSSNPSTHGEDEDSYYQGKGGITQDHLPTEPSRPPPPYAKLRPMVDSKGKTSVAFVEYMRDILRWQRPKEKDGHWPPYREFVNKDYDPNRWEGFQQ